MTEVYLGQVMMTGFNFAPKTFALCNGQIISIQQNQALFALLSITYGGNGTTNFALPDLRGRNPAGAGSSVDPGWQPPPYDLGQAAGVETVTLLTTHMPQHTHSFAASTQPATIRLPSAGQDYFAQTGTQSAWGPGTSGLVPLSPMTLTTYGNNGPHANMQPYRVVSFSIALGGVYPSRN